MAKKKAILHIGGHKTGTSAIQAFCLSNAARLEALGILYPLKLISKMDTMGGQAHHGLVNVFMDDTTFWKSYNMRPKSMTDAQIIDLLKTLPRDQNILLSSENLVWLDSQSIIKLKQILEGYDISVVLYVRRQDDALQALYQTVVATVGEDKRFNDYASEGVRALFEYDRIVEKWQSSLGTGTVIVRVYETDQLYKKDAISDFIHVMEAILQTNIDTADWHRSANIINRGFPSHIIALLRYFNSRKGKKWTLPAIKILSEILYKDARGSYEIILPSQRKELLNSFAESNRNLAFNYLGNADGQLFRRLTVNQTDKEWNDKYNRFGSNVWLLLVDIFRHIKKRALS